MDDEPEYDECDQCASQGFWAYTTLGYLCDCCREAYKGRYEDLD